ncbi:helix-turn-helix transcriptional regulator [Actinomadura sp. DC4]|uniref:helix-turn-helix domain-containing protein n=1 Tax=Actinomadura sp. DC4 TaxID=3055069 RepID=UPI0025AF5C02|nr:helix-turn-helix transcriptional regulator [Actinomadura sp. DC4]MDN3351478.1 helix-turn-helix transcriptional regulator [Actinomadura sp. DC4]
MPTRSAPTVKRRRLAAELRRYREAAELTLDEVAERLEWSNAKISRIENARVSVLPRDVKFLLGVYGIDGEPREVLLTLAREARQKGWWHSYGEAIPSWFEVYIGLEAEAVSIRRYESELVPGLLQTEEYATAIFRGFLMKEDEIEKRVALRMARQERLTGDDAPQLWIVLNESVIRRIVGGPATMHAQLDRLLDASHLPNVTMQVLPFAAGAHPAMDGAFVILSFPERTDSDVVYLEEQTGGLYLEKGHEIERHALAFDHLRAAALHPDASRRLISDVSDDLSRDA